MTGGEHMVDSSYTSLTFVIARCGVCEYAIGPRVSSTTVDVPYV